MRIAKTIGPLTIVLLIIVLVTLPGLGVGQEAATSDPGSAPQATPSNGNGTGHIQLLLNFQETPVRSVLDYLSEKAGLTIVTDVSLDGSITVISRQPIHLDDAITLINSVLREKDLVAIRSGKTLKVLPLSKARTDGGLPVTTGPDLDTVEAGDAIVTHVLPVRFLDAVALRENLLTLLADTTTIEANRDGNALIITGTTANIKRLMKIVQALDGHMAAVTEIQVFRLTRAQAASTAQLINSIFQQEQRTSSRSQQGGRNMLDMIMQASPGGRGGRGFSQDQTNQTNESSTTAGNARVAAAADERTNAIVVRGPSDVLKIVAGVIAKLDDSTATVAGVRVFQLRYADALNVAQVVNQLFGQNRTSSNSQQNNTPTFMRPGGSFPGMDSQETQADNTLQVTAAADSRTNTVVVTGPDAVLDVVEDTVKKLDAQIPNVADVKVFRLQYADASNTAQLLNQVFGASLTSSRSSSRNTQQSQQVTFQAGGRGGQIGTMGGQGTTADTASDVAVVAAADTRTNSVVVSGAPETLKIIGDVINELDQNPEQERRIFVYPLKNATASNLVTVLNNIFTQLRSFNQQTTGTTRTIGTTGGGGGGERGGGAAGGGAAAGGATGGSSESMNGANDLSDQTYFQADTTTNSLLVLTSTKNYTLVEPIIRELDKSVGQVLIKVLFAEISHTNELDFGTDLSALNLRTATSAFTGTPPMGTQGSTTFGKPTSGLGLTLNTIEGDWDATLRALEGVTKVNVLSRPYVLARNNQAATIKVVAEVPIPGTTTSNGSVGSTTTYSYRTDIGIVLTVTPQVNPDGVVNMTVTPSITNITGTAQVAAGLTADTFSTRSATTMVTVKDGQTIVIGGLIQDTITDTINRVPLLGAIPVVGALFGRTDHIKSKTELLIFLSPRVAQEPAKLTDISSDERKSTSLTSDSTVAPLFNTHMGNMEIGDPNRPKTTTEKDNQP